MSDRAPPMRWRKKTERYQRDTYELWCGGKRLAIAAQTAGGWYWYCNGINTSNKPAPLDDVKADAVRLIKAEMASNPQSGDAQCRIAATCSSTATLGRSGESRSSRTARRTRELD